MKSAIGDDSVPTLIVNHWMIAPEDSSLIADEVPTTAFLAYPSSRLAPPIVPQDLTNFKTRGIGRVERSLHQELTELREKYLAVIDAFNWNKLIYEAQFNFEPVIGETYHLYEMEGRHVLSMIPPQEWKKRWLGTFRLNADGRWLVSDVASDFDLRGKSARPRSTERGFQSASLR